MVKDVVNVTIEMNIMSRKWYDLKPQVYLDSYKQVELIFKVNI